MWSGKFKAEGKKVPGRKKKFILKPPGLSFIPSSLIFPPKPLFLFLTRLHIHQRLNANGTGTK
jgi:hypothetical protein